MKIKPVNFIKLITRVFFNKNLKKSIRVYLHLNKYSQKYYK